MRHVRYTQLDVFTSEPFGGNQLAVFFDATSLTDAEMQQIAREMNFSESVFVLPPTDGRSVARLRIFTPLVELPFAGHPVLGTIFALADAGRITPDTPPASTLELAIGPLDIDLLFEDARLSFAWMSQRLPTFTTWQGDRAALAANLGLRPSDLRDDLPIETGSAGTPHLLIPIRDAETLDRAAPGVALVDVMGADVPTGAYLFTMADHGQTVRSRMLGAMMGIHEDPATGSAVGPLGAYLVRHGLATAEDGVARISVAQGVKMGRSSRLVVTVEQREGVIAQVRVGGESVVMAHGEFMLPDAN